MGIKIIKDKCKACSICVKKCPFDAIEVLDGLAVVNDKCTICGSCIEVCPFDAIEKEVVELEIKDLSEYSGVWVYAEQRSGKLMPVVIELLGEGKKLANDIGTDLSAILIGHNVENLAEELIKYGADKIYIFDDSRVENYITDAHTTIIANAINKYKPEIVLCGATHIGRDLAPRVAARVDTGLTADCTALDIDPEDKNLRQTRPAFGGNLMATIVCKNHRPQMSTVRAGVMEQAEFNEDYKGEIIKLDIALTENDFRTEVIETVIEEENEVSLIDADFIISGGLGLGDAEGFKLLQTLAHELDGVIGASRAAVDEGWIPQTYQIGQTGSTVRPKIYIACGISGAIQHVAGMSNSDIIIAINSDENASIFDVADYGIVGDIYEVVPMLIEKLRIINAKRN